MVERPLSAAPVYQDGKEARPNHGKPHDWTDANTDQKGGQMAGNQELNGFRLWWRKMRKWVFGILAAAIMGMLLFYPGMAYIYERIGWRSPLLPRPGTEWLYEASDPGYLDTQLKVRWDTEDLSSYYRPSEVSSPYPTTFQSIIAVQEKEDMNRNLGIPMSRSVALVVLEVIDYVDFTKEAETDSGEVINNIVHSLVHCRVEKVLAQRKDMCRLQEGDNIVVWTYYASNYGDTGSAKDKPVLIRCGQKSIQLLDMSEKAPYRYAKTIADIAPYRAHYNIGINYIPIEEGRKPNLTSVSRFLYLPDAIKRYGPTKYWTLDILSKELQDYYDHSSYYYLRR